MNEDANANQGERVETFRLREVAALFFGCSLLAALPFLRIFPKHFDRGAFFLGACGAATAVLMLVFPEMRSRVRGKFAFRSKLRTFLCAVASVAVFFTVVYLSFLARANGWWR